MKYTNYADSKRGRVKQFTDVAEEPAASMSPLVTRKSSSIIKNAGKFLLYCITLHSGRQQAYILGARNLYFRLQGIGECDTIVFVLLLQLPLVQESEQNQGTGY